MGSSKKELLKINKNIYELVINKLNNTCKKRFKSNIKKTRSYIDARLKEGFSEEDFYKVIEHKSNQWLGSDMEKYLRPQTLFCEKFDMYLNEAPETRTSDSINTLDQPWSPHFDYN